MYGGFTSTTIVLSPSDLHLVLLSPLGDTRMSDIYRESDVSCGRR